MQKKPILSICIPTYNRYIWLKKNIEILLHEISSTNSNVEIIISDNNSDDKTNSLMIELKDNKNFILNRNSKNLGSIKNLNKCTDLASGKYVWLLGDDDFVLPNFLTQLTNILEKNSIDTPFIFITNTSWDPDDANNPFKSNHFKERYKAIDDSIIWKKMDHLCEIANIEHGYFNAICNIIIKNDHAKNLFKKAAQFDSIHTNITDTFPHSEYIAINLLNQPAIEVKTTGIISSSKVSWSKYYTITWIKILPDLIDLMIKHGTSKKDGSTAKKWILSHQKNRFANDLINGFVDQGIFSAKEFIIRNIKYKQFWLLLFKVKINYIKYLFHILSKRNQLHRRRS